MALPATGRAGNLSVPEKAMALPMTGPAGARPVRAA